MGRVEPPHSPERPPVDTAYLRFARANPTFYDVPLARTPGRRAGAFAPAADRDWSTWHSRSDESWSAWSPRGLVLPAQGWKIHVSTTLDEAAALLADVSRHCHDTGLSFKYVPHREELLNRNSKDADRAGSGKFITIYPRDEAELDAALTALETLVGGRPGPYILSDLRWNAGPLHVRYGAFAQAWTTSDDGALVPALMDPAGQLVEDRRTAAFTPPGWVTLPASVQQQLDALGDDAPPADFPYVITRVLHYSNAGGVYEATGPAGEACVLKESRPHAGLTPDGRDSITRLIDEERHLRALAHPTVVAVHGSATVEGHRFLALERVDGWNLNTAVVMRSPAIRADAPPAASLEYRQWALGIAARLDEAIARIHAAGFTHGDLHPGNVIVTPDDRVVLLDFEMASRIDDDRPVLIGAPGFTAPPAADAAAHAGIGADLSALACIKLFLFVPLTGILQLDPLKIDELTRSAQETYALDDDWLEAVRVDLRLPQGNRLAGRSLLAREADAAIRRWRTDSEDAVLALQVMIGRSLDASADFSRADRAWPGDPQQFSENGFGLAHGAAGVVHALHSSSLDVDPQALAWLDDTVADEVAARSPRLGLYDGLAGVVWLHRQHGRDDQADEILAQLRAKDLGGLGADLYGGLPGIGLLLLSEADRGTAASDALEAQCLRIAEELDERHSRRPPASADNPAPTVRTGQGGLMRGASGTALFALRLYRRTGDPRHLRLAERTLSYDLAHCALADDGSLQINEGWRMMPYLATGSAGIGLVLAELLPHTRDPEPYSVALAGIRSAASTPFVIEPGLFSGRAGLIHLLIALSRAGLSTAESDAALQTHVDALQLHAIRHNTGIGFPGQGLLRLSCDLATGSAGVLTALQAYELNAFDHERSGWDHLLPLLTPVATARAYPHTSDPRGR